MNRANDCSSTRSTPQMPTVLLVESDEDNRFMYGEYFSAVKIRAVAIADAADALALAHTADVIVTGLRVAGPFDAVELIHRLRTNERTKDKPIIVLTAWSFEPDRRRAYAAGCDGFLLKPCLPETLVMEIQRVMTVRCSRSYRTSNTIATTADGKQLDDREQV
jgi:two-component system, cell cycle response regulator DivK